MLDHITKREKILRHLWRARCSFRQQFRVFTCQLMSKQNTLPHVLLKKYAEGCNWERKRIVFRLLMWLHKFSFVYIKRFMERRPPCLPAIRAPSSGCQILLFFFFWCLPFLYTNQSSFKMTTLNTFPSGLIWLPLWWLPGAGRRQPPCSSGSGWRGWGWRRWLPRLGGCLLFWIDSTGCDDQRWASGHLEQRGSQDTVEVLKDK